MPFPSLISTPPLAGLLHVRVRLAWGVCLLELGLVACSPTYNWRELRSAGTPLQALMPCKPDVAQRPMPSGGESTTLHMHSCETGGITFAVAWADVGEAARTREALALLRRASLAAIRVDPAQVDAPALQWAPTVPGATEALGLQAQGTQHGERPVQMKAAHFARGQQVFQAAVYGPTLPDEAINPFFEGLRLP
jgi:hypothetical protein